MPSDVPKAWQEKLGRVFVFVFVFCKLGHSKVTTFIEKPRKPCICPK